MQMPGSHPKLTQFESAGSGRGGEGREEGAWNLSFCLFKLKKFKLPGRFCHPATLRTSGLDDL